jgi:hypothetical protein
MFHLKNCVPSERSPFCFQCLFHPILAENRGQVHKDGQLSFWEFVRYVVEHEKALQLVFSKLDVNKDGELLLVCPII